MSRPTPAMFRGMAAARMPSASPTIGDLLLLCEIFGIDDDDAPPIVSELPSGPERCPDEPPSYAEIGKELGLTGTRVMHIQREALAKFAARWAILVNPADVTPGRIRELADRGLLDEETSRKHREAQQAAAWRRSQRKMEENEKREEKRQREQAAQGIARCHAKHGPTDPRPLIAQFDREVERGTKIRRWNGSLWVYSSPGSHSEMWVQDDFRPADFYESKGAGCG